MLKTHKFMFPPSATEQRFFPLSLGPPAGASWCILCTDCVKCLAYEDQFPSL